VSLVVYFILNHGVLHVFFYKILKAFSIICFEVLVHSSVFSK